MGIINLGITAHVDAGKTTLTEQILYTTGIIRKAGRVDSGDAHTDTMEIERRRGISVKSASIQTEWNGVTINIIDTPGHMDFSSEIERALIALECAVLVVSAVEGVQSQTEIIFRALNNMHIPTVFFINKTDRMGADIQRTAADIESRLGIKLCDYTNTENIVEKLCEADDNLLEQYLEFGLSGIENKAVRLLMEKMPDCKISPYISGSAINGVGVTALLDMITDVCPRFIDKTGGKLSGIVYKIEHDKALGRIAHVKLYGGELNNRDIVHNYSQATDEKIFQIRKNHGLKPVDTGMLRAGEIGLISGLSGARPYDIIGEPAFTPSAYRLTAPLLKARAVPRNESDYPILVAAFNELTAEDPLLDMAWVKETRELVISITGLIQIEILKEVLLYRFSLEVDFEQPTVIYKETATITAEGFDAYTMPKPCWAILRFLIEPAARGCGVTYKSLVGTDKIMKAYQAQVEQALPGALSQGPLGWEVTDVNITLIDGEHHIMHTHPLDFIVTTPMAIMNGLVNAKTTLLEPLYKFRVSVPEELGGKIMNEVILMRGEYSDVTTIKDKTYIEGIYPVATGLDFSVRLASLTNGRASLSLDFGGYRECSVELGRTTPYRGVNPLDRAKYILSVRHAL